MGLSSSKTKTSSTSNQTTTPTPYVPATPAVNSGLAAAQQIYNANSGNAAANAATLSSAFQNLAPTAFSPSPYVTSAQNTASNIAGGQFLGANPGASTYSALQKSTNPASSVYSSIANGGGLGNDILTQIAQGNFVNGQPSADLYSRIMDPSYLTANPYLDSILQQSDNAVTKAANQRFAASGMGAGISSAFGDLLTKNLANSENQIRYTNYNDASNRQLQAAGQSDAAYNAARANQLSAAQDQASNQLAAAGGLNSAYGTQSSTQLGAAQAADSAQQSQIAQMLSAAGLAPSLANAQYAGVQPAIDLANAAATAPYTGLGAYSSIVSGLSNPYVATNSTGTSTGTSTSSMGLGSLVAGLGGSALAGWASSGFGAKR
jgi:hypothetical protein